MFVPWKLSLWLQRWLPAFLLKPLKSAYTSHHAGVMRRMDARLEIIVAQLFPTRPARVVAGPFQGMNYVGASVGSALVPKLVGSYEVELSGAIEQMARHGYDRIFNVGCAEGYYAVGLARFIPQARVVVFEMEEKGRALVRAMAERNSVLDRFEILGTCEPQGLASALATPSRTLVICDVEGYEDVLMNPVACPPLTRAHILVELHDCKNAGVSERVSRRFEATHDITILWQQRRTAAEFPLSTAYTRKIDPEHLAAAIDEGRPVRLDRTPMSWFWMTPKGIA